jgi:adenosylcobinamide kinase/adenosylcobinamide-phosphate guanylyltransferase
LFAPDAGIWPRERKALLDTLPTLASRVIMVSNETGWGIVPMGAETRRYVDETGRLHQDIAALAQRVTLVVAGLPMTLKGYPA